MNFTKMHGLGNDYVYVNGFTERVDNPSALARAVSDRHTGIGSDGLILIQPSDSADVRMEMYNADGSRSEMCGNGIRCVAKYAVDHGLANGPDVRIETDDGVKRAECRRVGASIVAVCVHMGRPEFSASAIPSTISVDRIIDHTLMVGGIEYAVTCVSLGNPHAVVFVEDLATVDPATIGPLFEHAPEFPKRINIHFARVESATLVAMRTWERGSGETRACGTGACAVTVAGAITKRTQRRITTRLPGGELQIDWMDDDEVLMTGAAVEVFTGVWPS